MRGYDGGERLVGDRPDEAWYVLDGLKGGIADIEDFRQQFRGGANCIRGEELAAAADRTRTINLDGEIGEVRDTHCIEKLGLDIREGDERAGVGGRLRVFNATNDNPTSLPRNPRQRQDNRCIGVVMFSIRQIRKGLELRLPRAHRVADRAAP